MITYPKKNDRTQWYIITDIKAQIFVYVNDKIRHSRSPADKNYYLSSFQRLGMHSMNNGRKERGQAHIQTLFIEDRVCESTFHESMYRCPRITRHDQAPCLRCLPPDKCADWSLHCLSMIFCNQSFKVI